MKAIATQKTAHDLVCEMRRKRNNLHVSRKDLWEQVNAFLPEGSKMTFQGFQNLLFRKTPIRRMDYTIFGAIRQWVEGRS